MSTSSTTSYKNLPASQFIEDSEQRKVFFAKCVLKERNHLYREAEIQKRIKIIPNVFALCAKLCSGDDYPNIKDLPAEAFDILFPAAGLQSCHWEMLLDQSNKFLADRLAHFNQWVGDNGLPPNLAEMRNEHLATLALAAAKEQGALAANQQLTASFQAALNTTASVMGSYNHMVSQLTAERDAALAAATLAAAALAAATGGSTLSSDPKCWYCENNRCNKH
jgi:hypothetical protein